MKLLTLFLTFLKIGAVSFGGGYGMISLMREDCLANGWLDESQLLDFIAVAESTPGPIAVNMATFIGSSQGGLLGALVSTLGVILASFVIILLIASVMDRVFKYPAVKATLASIRPAIAGMILATAITMLLSVVFEIKTLWSEPAFDWKSLCIFGVICLVHFGYSKLKKKQFSPILLIVISGVLGIILF